MDQTVQKSQLRIALTPEQTEQIKQATGKAVPAVKLALVDLEQRIAPFFDDGLPGCHNN